MQHIIKIDKEVGPFELGENFLKIVVVGAPRCGKTTFITNIVVQNFLKIPFYDNTVAVYPCEHEVNGMTRLIAFYEIPSNSEFSLEERTKYYEKADIILYMYAIDDPSSLEMLVTKYIPETSDIIKAKPTSVILFGNKIDLRGNQDVIDRLASNNEVLVTPDKTQGLFEPGLEKFFVMEISSKKQNDCLLAFINICDYMFPFIIN